MIRNGSKWVGESGTLHISLELIIKSKSYILYVFWSRFLFLRDLQASQYLFTYSLILSLSHSITHFHSLVRSLSRHSWQRTLRRRCLLHHLHNMKEKTKTTKKFPFTCSSLLLIDLTSTWWSLARSVPSLMDCHSLSWPSFLGSSSTPLAPPIYPTLSRKFPRFTILFL